MAFVVYPVMAQAEVMLAGRQTAELGPTQDAENHTQIFIYPGGSASGMCPARRGACVS